MAFNWLGNVIDLVPLSISIWHFDTEISTKNIRWKCLNIYYSLSTCMLLISFYKYSFFLTYDNKGGTIPIHSLITLLCFQNNNQIKKNKILIRCLLIVYMLWFLLKTVNEEISEIHAFISNARLKLAKNQAVAKQHLVAEPLLFENYSHSSSMLSSKNNGTFSKK